MDQRYYGVKMTGTTVFIAMRFYITMRETGLWMIICYCASAVFPRPDSAGIDKKS